MDIDAQSVKPDFLSLSAAIRRIRLSAALVPVVAVLTGCKIVIQTPEHGMVESVSGTYLCQPDSTCEIDVDDTDFDEVFIARSTDDSRTFSHWRPKFRGEDRDYFCGKRTGQCALFTTEFSQFDFLLAVLETDRAFFLEPVFTRSVDSGGTVVAECLLPQFPEDPQDYSAWNNNCDYNTTVSWVDEGPCASGCSASPAALKQTDRVEDFTGNVVWAACPGSQVSPTNADGSPWRGEDDYVCTSEPGTRFASLGDPTPEAATLSEIQTRIFDRSCAFSGCHAGAAPAAGQNLSAGQAFANLVNIPSSQNPAFIRVIPGDADNSLLVRKVEGTAPFGSRMPLGGPPLGDREIQSIRDWIEAGALDN